MNTIEAQPKDTSEDVDETLAPETKKTDLEYVREQAQTKIDAYLADPELSDPQRIELFPTCNIWFLRRKIICTQTI